MERSQRVAVLLAGDLRSFLSAENWRTWASHVVGPLQNRGYHVDTFLCTSPLEAAQAVKPVVAHTRNGSHIDGLPMDVVRSLHVVKWLQRTVEDFDSSFFACILEGMGCLTNVTKLWCAGSTVTRYPGPSEFCRWLAASNTTRYRAQNRINLERYLFLDEGKTLCSRFSTILVRSAECYQAARVHSRGKGDGVEYDWYMHGRPDMAWFEDSPLPSVLQRDAISLRAREMWGHPNWPISHFQLTDNQRSYGWGQGGNCGGIACRMTSTPRAPCVLADDTWAWIPNHLASAYYLADAGCTSGWQPEALPSHVAGTAMSERAAERTTARPAWSPVALEIVYNGEGLLTARLLQLGISLDVVPAALRFRPVKLGSNWNTARLAVEAPRRDANNLTSSCAPLSSAAAAATQATRAPSVKPVATAPGQDAIHSHHRWSLASSGGSPSNASNRSARQRDETIYRPGRALSEQAFASTFPKRQPERPAFWPQRTAAEQAADAELRDRIARGKVPLSEDKKPMPPGWSVSLDHLKACTSCFHDEYVASVHAQPLQPLPQASQLFVDDHAIESTDGIVRQLERPTKRLTNLQCPGHCRLGEAANERIVRDHLSKNHFGMYGSVDYRNGRYRIWLGEWEPFYAESDDGVTWSTLQLLKKLHGNGGSYGWSPRNLCIMHDDHEPRVVHKYKMGYHCGNYRAEESTCLATSTDGFSWEPYQGGRRSKNDNLHCEQMPQCCGPACRAAADTLNCFHYRRSDASYWLINRKNFGTAERWREIRGVRLSRNAAFHTHFKNFEEKHAWYFDRLGKQERFQRQIYSMSVTDMPREGLYLGLLTVLEWPKVGSLEAKHPLPPYKHDIMSVYLVTSRDGVLFDLSTVYSYNQLLPRGMCSPELLRNATSSSWLETSIRGCEFDHGYVQPASQMVISDDGRLHLFYEGRPVPHEDRWKAPARIGVATWEPQRLAALIRPPGGGASECGTIRLRPFHLNGTAITVNAHAPQSTSSIVVQVHVGLQHNPPVLEGHVQAGDGQQLAIEWHGSATLEAQRGRLLRVVLRLCGVARLYAFTVHLGPAYDTQRLQSAGKSLQSDTSDKATRSSMLNETGQVAHAHAHAQVSPHSSVPARRKGPASLNRRLRHKLWGTGSVGRAMVSLTDASTSESIFSYAPHSGLSNQLFSLMAAVQIAHSTGLNFLLPPLVVGKTVGPICGQCEPHEHPGGPLQLRGSVANLNIVLNMSFLSAVLVPEQSTHGQVIPYSNSTDVVPPKNAGVSTRRLCHVHRTHLVLMPRGECDSTSMGWLQNNTGKCGSRHRVPVSCLRALADRLTTATHPVENEHNAVAMGYARNRVPGATRPSVRVHLRLGSLYQIVDGDLSHAVGRGPVQDVCPKEIVFNDRVRSAAAAVVHRARFRSANGHLACAHLRMGQGAWDVQRTFFADRAAALLAGLEKWLGTLDFTSHALIATDNINGVMRQRTASKCFAQGRCSMIEDHLRELKIPDGQLLESMPLLSTISQEACSMADTLLLTKGSSFSSLIELLWNRRAQKDTSKPGRFTKNVHLKKNVTYV